MKSKTNTTTFENTSLPTDYSVKHLTSEVLHDLTHFDTKFINTIKPLLIRPGFLTEKAFTGEQSKYVKPIALFVFINFVFFIFKSRGVFNYQLDGYQSLNFFREYTLSTLNKTHLSGIILADRFNLAMRFEEKEYLVIMLPLFALVLYALYFPKKRHYIEHLIFTLHFYSFLLIYLMLSPILFRIIGLLTGLVHVTLPDNEITFICMSAPILFLYLYVAMKRFYSEGWFPTTAKTSLGLLAMYYLIKYVYHSVMFFIVMRSIME